MAWPGTARGRHAMTGKVMVFGVNTWELMKFDCCHIETFTIILWVNLISSCQEALEIRYAGMSRRYLIHSREAGKRCLMSLPLPFLALDLEIL